MGFYLYLVGFLRTPLIFFKKVEKMVESRVIGNAYV